MFQNLGSAAGAHKIRTNARIALALVDSFASLLVVSKSTGATFIRPILSELSRFTCSTFWVVGAHLVFFAVLVDGLSPSIFNQIDSFLSECGALDVLYTLIYWDINRSSWLQS